MMGRHSHSPRTAKPLRSHFGKMAKWKPAKEIKVFKLTESELIKIRGHHDLGSWKVACAGCSKMFDESDVGRTIVSVPRKKPRRSAKIYYHLKCWNERNITKEERP